jgi:hypothetical protein
MGEFESIDALRLPALPASVAVVFNRRVDRLETRSTRRLKTAAT